MMGMHEYRTRSCEIGDYLFAPEYGRIKKEFTDDLHAEIESGNEIIARAYFSDLEDAWIQIQELEVDLEEDEDAQEVAQEIEYMKQFGYELMEY